MFVYLIGSSDGYCKIGSAKNSASRLSQLDGTKLPFELTLLAEVEAGEAAYRIERRLQEKFKAKHVRGEWFLRISAKEFLSKAKHYVKMDVAPKHTCTNADTKTCVSTHAHAYPVPSHARTHTSRPLTDTHAPTHTSCPLTQ